jgi:hypothetical protein
MYLGWYDPDKKKKARDKLADAVERYERKWGRRPAVALVNSVDAPSASEFPSLEVRVAAHVAPNTFFVGEDEPDEVAQAA